MIKSKTRVTVKQGIENKNLNLNESTSTNKKVLSNIKFTEKTRWLEKQKTVEILN